MRKILAVDDDPRIVDAIAQYFDSPEYEVYTLLEGAKVPEIVSRIEPDLILLDLKLPDVNGIDILRDLKKRNFKGPIVIITGKVSAGVAIESMKEGAYEYLPKPFRLEELGKLVGKLLAKDQESQITSTIQNEIYESQQSEELVGKSTEILKIGKIIGQAASSEAPVLITGESGTGKELIAKIIHGNSKRFNCPFIVVNCAYPSHEMLEEELFGKNEGDQGKNLQKRQSKFELCKGGTIFLDDIGNMRLSTQNKLLRIIKKGDITPTQKKTGKTDVRVIASCSQDLSPSVSQGKFTQELFYYLRVISIVVPPLRERKSDIPILADYFIKKYCQQSKKPAPEISADALRLLMKYSWPGNVREFENNIYSAIEMCKGDKVLPENLPIFFESNLQTQTKFEIGKDDYSHLFLQILDPMREELFNSLKGNIHDQLISSLEKAVISITLNFCQGNQVKAAELLGISRNTLRERMLKFGLHEKGKPTHPIKSPL